MTLIGTLFRNRRAGEARSVWNQPNLRAPETLSVASVAFADGARMPVEHSGRRVGGRNLSPPLAWSAPPAGTAQLLLVVEDLDVPMRRPLVHCLALVEPAELASPGGLPEGALSGPAPAPGVCLLRSFIGHGYKGPEPLKGHRPHRYVFELFALAAALPPTLTGTALDRTKPRGVLERVSVPLLCARAPDRHLRALTDSGRRGARRRARRSPGFAPPTDCLRSAVPSTRRVRSRRGTQRRPRV